MSETRVNALSYSMFMYNVITQCGGQATGKRVKELWFNSQGGKNFVSSPKHPDWLCTQPSLLSSADQGLFLPWVKRLGNAVLKLRMSGAIPPLPYVFMVCTGTTLTLFPEMYELYV
jgi:hypothetical protein